MKKSVQIAIMSGGWWLVSGWTAVMQVMADDAIGKIKNPYSGSGSVCGSTTYINKIIAFLTAAACVFFLITIILSGINIITKARSPDDFAASMKKIGLGAVGLVIVALSWVIAGWLSKLLFGDAAMMTNPLKVLTGC
jgi:hypothetical protein